MDKSYAQTLSEHRRRALLEILRRTQNGTANAGVLQITLTQVGLETTADQTATEIAWLEEQGLLSTRTHEGSSIASLTPRGADAIKSDAHMPGVARLLE